MCSRANITDEIQAKIHTRSEEGAGVIIISYPGYNGSVDGYASKYEKIANLLQRRGVGAVIRLANQERSGVSYLKSVVDDLAKVIDYSLKNATALSGVPDPKVYLMGFSAGASAVAAVAGNYPQVKKILLVAPSGDAGTIAMKKGLSVYTGDVYVTVGEQDKISTQDFCEKILSWAKNARVRAFANVPNCDHHFRGKRNGMIFSKAPLWAFAGDATYPEPDGGVVLYR